MFIKIFTYCLLILFCVIGLISLEDNLSKEHIYNTTSVALSKSIESSSESFRINENATEMNDIIINIIYKSIDTTLYIFDNVSKIVIKLALENPQLNFKLILFILIVSLLIPIILGLIKIIAIFYVLIKDIIDEKKYKKRLKENEK